ncbi:MAG: hypothetical protein WEC81_00060 [Patescibacteria group bacterium]
MAEPIQPLVPEDIGPEELEEALEPQELEVEDQDQGPDRIDQLKDQLKEKYRENQERKRQEQEQAKQTEAEKPPQQTEQPAENPELTERKQAKTQNEVDRVKSGEQKLQKATGKVEKTAGKEAVGAAERETAVAAKQGAKVAGKAAGQAAKAAAQATAQAVRAAVAATSEIWGPVLIVILIIVVIVAVIFILFSFSKGTGKGPAQYPATAYDQTQIVSLLAVSSDSNATREKVLTEINKMEERLNGLKSDARKKYNATKAQAAGAEIDIIIEQINLLKPVADDPVGRKTIIDKINISLGSLAIKYPELLFSAGNCGDLQSYIDGGQFVIARSPERSTIAKGYLVRGGHSSIARSEQGQVQINPKLCNVILFVLKNGYDIGGVTLTFGHRKYSSGTTFSQHYVAEAIDIASLNGASFGSAKWKSQSSTLMQLLQQNYKQLGIWELWGPTNFSVNDCKTTGQTIGGHDNHIHLGVTNPTKEQACR